MYIDFFKVNNEAPEGQAKAKLVHQLGHKSGGGYLSDRHLPAREEHAKKSPRDTF